MRTAARTDEMLTVRQAAHLLKYDPQTVYSKIRSGEIKAEKIGRFRLIRRDAIMGLIDERIKLIAARAAK